jgi:hypothetical protein
MLGLHITETEACLPEARVRIDSSIFEIYDNYHWSKLLRPYYTATRNLVTVDFEVADSRLTRFMPHM